MGESISLSGRMLLAMPGIGDPRFTRAAIAICAHDGKGALGIGIGETMAGLTLHTLLAQLEIDSGVAPDVPVLTGGPVEPHRGFVLHSPDWGGEETMLVADGLALTGTLDILRAIAAGEGPRRWLVALGYAGWGPGQLEDELTRHGWFEAPLAPSLLFETPVDTRWTAAFAGAGVDARLLTATAGRA